MANYANLKAQIDANIYQNDQSAITGAVMNAQLKAIVNALGAGFQFIGVATPTTDPGTLDGRVFYIAAQAGTYTNFGNTVLSEGQIGIFTYGSSWTYTVKTVVEIVDDLTTGGSGKALSAEQGKTLASLIAESARFVPPAFPCFVAAGADYEDMSVTFTFYQQSSPAQIVKSSIVFRSFLWMKLQGFDPTKKYVVSNIRRNYGAGGTSAYQVAISELSNGARTNEIFFRFVPLVTNPGGANYISVDAYNGDQHMDAIIDFSLIPDGGTTGMISGSVEVNNWKISDDCFINYADAAEFSATKAIVDALNANALLDSDLTVGIISNNIADPEGVMLNTVVTSTGKISSNTDWDTYKLPVTPGLSYTFGGFKLGRTGVYAFYNGTTKLSYANFNDPLFRDRPVTVTAPENATFLYFTIRSGSSPSDPWSGLQINAGAEFLDYDVFEKAITKINNIEVAGQGGGGGDLSTLIQDLPVSADGAGIAQGYAYINSSTGAVIVKQ